MRQILASIIFSFMVVNVIARSVSKGEKKDDTKEQYYDKSDFDIIYDQRQNATENYRLDVSGVDIVVAPPSSLLQAIFSPLTVIALLDEFSRKAPISMLKKKVKPEKESATDIRSPEATTITPTTVKNNEKLDDVPRNPMKNFEEKIQVEELLQVPLNDEKIKKETSDSTKESSSS